MDPSQPIRVGIRFRKIHIAVAHDAQNPPTLPPTYLWTVFYKIDGDSASVGENLTLQGRATVFGTAGDHGDLGNTQVAGDVPIPRQIGEFRTILQPIPVIPFRGTSQGTVPGQIGGIAVLLVANGTPNDAVLQGHNAMNRTFQDELDNLIPTLGIRKPQPSQADISTIKQGISDAVRSAISSNVTIWQFLSTGGNEDFSLGTVSLQYSGLDLVSMVPPSGLLFEGALQYGEQYGEAGWWHDTWNLSGSVYVDALDFSLSRFMAEEGLNPANGVRASLIGASISRVREWIIRFSPTS